MAQAEAFLAGDAAVEPGRPGSRPQPAIEKRATGALSGDCGFHVLTEQPQTAQLGITLASEYQGRGFATEALTEIMGWLFDQLGLHRLFAHADDRNHGVHRLFDRVGLRPEARFIDADWFKGEWTTLRVYALLRKEWGARRRQPEPGRRVGRPAGCPKADTAGTRMSR